MKPEEIKILIDKYFDAETSLAEERQLKAYFSRQGEMHPSLLPYKPLFSHLAEAKTEVPEGSFFLPIRRKPQFLWMKYAAAILVLVSMGWWLAFPPSGKAEQVSGIDWSKYEAASPEEAFRVTRNALMEVAGVIDQSTESSDFAGNQIRSLNELIKIR